MRAVTISLIAIFFISSCGEKPVWAERLKKFIDSAKKDTSFFPEKFCADHDCYTIFFKRQLHAELTKSRPSKKDSSIRICIPAAFTRLDNDSIDGLFMVSGKTTNRKSVNLHLGGGLLIRHDSVFIIGTDNGRSLDENWISTAEKDGSFFCQQIRMVVDGTPQSFHRDQSRFQRRAVMIMQDGNVAIVESGMAITLDQFAHDLLVMKAWNAIYTDMGDWDEGWYRDETTGNIITIGTSLASTDRQSNWIIFRKNP